MSEVWFVKRDTLSETGFGAWRIATLGPSPFRRPSWPKDYYKVAEVSGNEHVCFSLIQNVTKPWSEDERVKAFVKHDRSMSVDDVVVKKNGRIFMCIPLGWEEIDA